MEDDNEQQGPDFAAPEALDDVVDPVEHGNRMSELFPRFIAVYAH